MKHIRHVAKHATQPIPIPTFTPKKKKKNYRWLCILLGIPALFPLLCIYPDIVFRRAADLNIGASDTLGTGAELTLLIALFISPLILVTGKRWLFPLRKWYGIMTGVIAVVAGIVSPILSLRFGPDWMITGNLALATGYILVVLLIPLLAISNKWSAKKLGKYWPKVQSRLTYAVWFLLGFHLVVLFGLSPHANGPILHQRVYLYVLCSLALLFFRIPAIKKAITHLRKARYDTAIYIMSIPWIALFVVPFSFIVNEEVFKGVAILTSHGIAD
jgi:DMSO/TMAO reductase YedYZ heme-binding membrane subunit